jgi:hypothetical protein
MISFVRETVKMGKAKNWGWKGILPFGVPTVVHYICPAYFYIAKTKATV